MADTRTEDPLGRALWEREFPADFAVPPTLSNDPMLQDDSWHNDVCPSFRIVGIDTGFPYPKLWVHHPVQASREFPESHRFNVTTGDCERTVYDGDDQAVAVAILMRLSWLNLIGRSHAVISTSDGAEEHANLITELADVIEALSKPLPQEIPEGIRHART